MSPPPSRDTTGRDTTGGDTPDVLADVLGRACAALENRADFYRHLLAATVYAPGERQGRSCILQHWQRQDDGSAVIPFFSSVALLEQALGTSTPFVRLTGRALFRQAGETPLLLNPFSSINKNFPVEEVRVLRCRAAASVLLYGDDTPGQPEAHLLVGTPDPLPARFLESLGNRLIEHDDIEAAYAVCTFQPDSGDTEQLLLALCAPDPVPDLLTDLELELAPLLPERIPLTCVWLDETHPLYAYILNETPPAYRKGLAGRVERTMRNLMRAATERA